MLSLKPLTLNRILPLGAVEALRHLLQEMAQLHGAIWITEDVLAKAIGQQVTTELWVAVVSEPFSALLRGKPIEKSKHQEGHDWQVGLSFDTETIAQFLSQLIKHLEKIAPTERPLDLSVLKQTFQKLQPNQANIQSEFTLQLVQLLTNRVQIQSTSDSFSSNLAVCKPVEDALHQQLEQERLLNQVTSQIRQSLELPVILSTAVEQVQQLLLVDRLLIYKFDRRGETRGVGGDEETFALEETELDDRVSPQISSDCTTDRCFWGSIIYEALSGGTISSVLHFQEGINCFPDVPNHREKYRKGFVKAISDIEVAYASHSCFLELMQQCQVKAKLIVPIVVQEELWGLLLAHQCKEKREWKESEVRFLSQIAEHLAIAIYQAELYAEVQRQRHTLEQRVIERTQELRDALGAAQLANRAKSEFLAAMSHELRTPLTCVIGISATMLRWFYNPEGNKQIPLEKQRNYLQIIQDSGEHLLGLINDILELSQVEAGRTVLKISEFSLKKLAYQALSDFKEKAIKKKIELILENQVEPERDRFTADPHRLKQILSNIISNAIKFTPSYGQVTLRLWVEEGEGRLLGGRQEGSVNLNRMAIFQVEDTGIGIPDDQQSLVFEKFQQLDSPYRRQYGGTGLGLALTKQLVELHRGIIEVESAVDSGSTFTVLIPSQLLKTDEGLKTRTEKHDSSFDTISSTLKGHIVLIEENEDAAMLMCDILTAVGLQVVWMIEGSQAVEQIELLQPHAVIVDMRLPGRDGSEIIHQLRNRSATYSHPLKILALIAETPLGNQANLLPTGADDYLTKPIQPQELLLKISTLMARNDPE